MNSSFLFFFNHLTVIGFILATLILEKKISLLLLKVFHCVTGSLWIDEKNKQKRKKNLFQCLSWLFFSGVYFVVVIIICRWHFVVGWNEKKKFFFLKKFLRKHWRKFLLHFLCSLLFFDHHFFFFILSEKLFFCLTSFSTLCWNDDETWNTPTHTPRKNTNKIMNVDDNKKNVTNTIYTPMNVCVCVKSIENFFFKI